MAADDKDIDVNQASRPVLGFAIGVIAPEGTAAR
jgi:hypothetical protein